jgi:ABC-type multidrug transport system ATPase subunit
MAYVMQDDIFFPEITVRETVRTAAMLKLPRKMSSEAKKEAVEDVLNELGIARCANTMIGGGWVVRASLARFAGFFCWWFDT